jgi:hypothetical protein
MLTVTASDSTIIRNYILVFTSQGVKMVGVANKKASDTQSVCKNGRIKNHSSRMDR